MSDFQTLRDSLPQLTARDREFAESLLAQSTTRGLSSKQLPWINRLIERASKPAPSAQAVGDCAGLVDFMSQGGPRASIVLRASETVTLRLSIAGARSSAPGSIVVTSPGAYGSRSFYGRVIDGMFSPGRDCGADLSDILGALHAMTRDPAGTAANHGHVTGICCFCASELTDAPSLVAGYGPVCAKRYGLPWTRVGAPKSKPVREG